MLISIAIKLAIFFCKELTNSNISTNNIVNAVFTKNALKPTNKNLFIRSGYRTIINNNNFSR